MPQTNEAENTAPNVQDKRKPAPGVLPKNAQSWVVIGLTAVIMLLLWVSGPAHGAKATKNSDAVKTETVSGLSSGDIAARLDQERREQQTASMLQSRSPGQQAGRLEAGSPVGDPQTAVPAEQDPIKQDIRRRQYTSLFSSSVSLSYRPKETSETETALADASSRLPQDTNKLLVAMLEQQLLTTERNRTSNVGSINTELYRQQHFSDLMSFTSSMPNRLQAPGSK